MIEYFPQRPSDEELEELRTLAGETQAAAPSMKDLVEQQAEDARAFQEAIEEGQFYLRRLRERTEENE